MIRYAVLLKNYEKDVKDILISNYGNPFLYFLQSFTFPNPIILFIYIISSTIILIVDCVWFLLTKKPLLLWCLVLPHWNSFSHFFNCSLVAVLLPRKSFQFLWFESASLLPTASGHMESVSSTPSSAPLCCYAYSSLVKLSMAGHCLGQVIVTSIMVLYRGSTFLFMLHIFLSVVSRTPFLCHRLLKFVQILLPFLCA